MVAYVFFYINKGVIRLQEFPVDISMLFVSFLKILTTHCFRYVIYVLLKKAGMKTGHVVSL